MRGKQRISRRHRKCDDIIYWIITVIFMFSPSHSGPRMDGSSRAPIFPQKVKLFVFRKVDFLLCFASSPSSHPNWLRFHTLLMSFYNEMIERMGIGKVVIFTSLFNKFIRSSCGPLFLRGGLSTYDRMLAFKLKIFLFAQKQKFSFSKSNRDK
jgi:hypothetical protein